MIDSKTKIITGIYNMYYFGIIKRRIFDLKTNINFKKLSILVKHNHKM